MEAGLGHKAAAWDTMATGELISGLLFVLLLGVASLGSC